MLTKNEIEAMIESLNEKLKKDDLKVRLTIVGGAVFCFKYQCRESTYDIDIINAEGPDISSQIFETAQEFDKDENWLNKIGPEYIEHRHYNTKILIEKSNIVISHPNPSFLLASKFVAGRDRDVADINFLLKHLGINSIQDVKDYTKEFFPRRYQENDTEKRIEGLVSEFLKKKESKS